MIWAVLTLAALLIFAVWYLIRRAEKKGKIEQGHDQLKETVKNVEEANEARKDASRKSIDDKRNSLYEDWGGK